MGDPASCSWLITRASSWQSSVVLYKDWEYSPVWSGDLLSLDSGVTPHPVCLSYLWGIWKLLSALRADKNLGWLNDGYLVMKPFLHLPGFSNYLYHTNSSMLEIGIYWKLRIDSRYSICCTGIMLISLLSSLLLVHRSNVIASHRAITPLPDSSGVGFSQISMMMLLVKYFIFF